MINAATFTSRSDGREMVRRPTALAVAFDKALRDKGYDTSHAKAPAKYEPSVRVKRAPRPKKKR